jgi:hypothetical protein
MRACEVCGGPLLKRHKQCCSRPCMAVAKRKKIDTALLQRVAREGIKFKHIVGQLGLSMDGLRYRLRAEGLYREWTKQRYKKYSEVA